MGASLVLAQAASAKPLELDALGTEQLEALDRWLSALTDASLPCKWPQAERPAFLQGHVANTRLDCHVHGRDRQQTRSRTASLRLTNVLWLKMPISELSRKFIGGTEDSYYWASETQYTLNAPYQRAARQVTAWWEEHNRPARQTAPRRWEASIEAGSERLSIQNGRTVFTTSMSE